MKAMTLMSIMVISYICGLIVFFSMRKHLLLTLMGVEFMMVNMYMIMFLNFLSYGCEFYFLIFFLVMLVCEGSLSLSILVSLIRSHGNDMINSLYLMLW
uniref:NADH-ubiquinone oxidoreductase chain 4L n=1 Tax=Perissonemia borneenis TaxID=1964418 RepID=A0A343BT87_9HEMI|nr:NADH dehydrogenase subunit 4L [Perissonemia borneenis]